MFISFFDLYWSRKAVISRLRARYVEKHGQKYVVCGHKLSKDGKRVVPNTDNLVIEVIKNGIQESITVTPHFDNAEHVTVMLPLSLVKDQLKPVQENPKKCVWRPDGDKSIWVFKQEEHIALRFRPPFDQSKEELLHFLVDAAYMQVDSEPDEDEGDVLVAGETRDGHEVVMV